MSPAQRWKPAAGLSLVELMIALVIGSLLMVGLIQIFSSSRSAYQLSEGLARAQENARFAMDYLQRDLRMAGHFGCVNDQAHARTTGALTNHYGATPAFPVDFAISIQGYEASDTAPGDISSLATPAAGWAPALPGVIADLAPLPGSDIVVLRFLERQGAPVSAIANTASSTTFTVPAARWEVFTGEGVGDPIMFGVADCSNANVFARSAAAPGAGTVTTAALIDRFTPLPSGQTMLYRANSLVYFIRDGASGEPSLFRARFNGTAYVPEELVEGIENMQFLYGLDGTTDPTTAAPTGYIEVNQTADTVGATAADWLRTGTVQLGLLARSPQSAAAPAAALEASRPHLLGVRLDPPTPNDTRYRSAYETTVALRNRLYGN